MSTALYSKDGQNWADGTPVNWSRDETVSKLVIGTPPRRSGGEPELISPSNPVPEDLGGIYPNLTHVYLRQIKHLEVLPHLPDVSCLDVRGCVSLRELQNIPQTVETLLIEDAASQLAELPNSTRQFMCLKHLSLKGCVGLPEALINGLLQRIPNLRILDLSGCSIKKLQPKIKEQSWPDSLVDIRLNSCGRLKRFPPKWPPALRRLELRQAKSIEEIPELPLGADYIDLAGTKSLRRLPQMPTPSDAHATRRPRTCFCPS